MAAKVAFFKIYLDLVLLNRKANWLETSLEVLMLLVDQKAAKLIWLEIQDGRHLENLYWSSFHEAKGQLTRNLSGNEVSDTGPSCLFMIFILILQNLGYWRTEVIQNFVRGLYKGIYTCTYIMLVPSRICTEVSAEHPYFMDTVLFSQHMYLCERDTIVQSCL